MTALMGIEDGKSQLEAYVATAEQLGVPVLLAFGRVATAAYHLLRFEADEGLRQVERARRGLEELHDPRRELGSVFGFGAVGRYLRGDFGGGDRALARAEETLQGELEADQRAWQSARLARVVRALLRREPLAAAEVARGMRHMLPLMHAWFQAEALGSEDPPKRGMGRSPLIPYARGVSNRCGPWSLA